MNYQTNKIICFCRFELEFSVKIFYLHIFIYLNNDRVKITYGIQLSAKYIFKKNPKYWFTHFKASGICK